MQIEELRMNRKMGASDPDLIQQLEEHKKSLRQRLAAVDEELKSGWTQWDAVLASGTNSPSERKVAVDKLVDILNRRSYIRNLVRDVNEALEV